MRRSDMKNVVQRSSHLNFAVSLCQVGEFQLSSALFAIVDTTKTNNQYILMEIHGEWEALWPTLKWYHNTIAAVWNMLLSQFENQT